MSQIDTTAQDATRDLELHFEGAEKVVPLRHALSKGTRKNSYWGVLHRDANTGQRFFRRTGVRLTTALAESLPSYVDIVDPVTGASVRVDLVADDAKEGREAVRANKVITLPGVEAERQFRCLVSETTGGAWNLTIVANNMGRQEYEVDDL